MDKSLTQVTILTTKIIYFIKPVPRQWCNIYVRKVCFKQFRTGKTLQIHNLKEISHTYCLVKAL